MSVDTLVRDSILAKLPAPPKGDTPFWNDAAHALLTQTGRMLEALGEPATKEAILALALDHKALPLRLAQLVKAKPHHKTTRTAKACLGALMEDKEVFYSVLAHSLTMVRKAGLLNEGPKPIHEAFVDDVILAPRPWVSGDGDTPYWDDQGREQLYLAAMLVAAHEGTLDDPELVIHLAMDPAAFKSRMDLLDPTRPEAQRIKTAAAKLPIEPDLLAMVRLHLGLRLRLWTVDVPSTPEHVEEA